MRGRGIRGPSRARRIRLRRRGAAPVRTLLLKSRDLTLFLRLLRQARPFWRHLAGFFLLSLVASPLALLRPLPLKIAVDSGIASHPLPGPLRAILPGAAPAHWYALLLAAGLLVAITLAPQLQTLAATLLRAYTGDNLLLDFRAELFCHMQRLALLFPDAMGTDRSL